MWRSSVTNKIAHVSLFKRDGAHFQGVEKFAAFLKMAIPELEVFAWTDCPVPTLKKQDWELAEVLNNWLLGIGYLDENSTVIGDGFWVNGLQGKVARLISVVHGSYIGTCIEHEKNPWDGEPQLGDWALKQEEIWKDDRVEVVAVSTRSAFELETVCGIESTVIEHGIPLDIYKPLDQKNRNPDLVLHVASPGRKAKDIVDDVISYGKFRIEKLGYQEHGTFEEEAALWNRGAVLFAPTRYEGNSYGLLEAIACGLIPVAYATGYACDLPCDVGEVSDDNHAANWVMLLERVLQYPRAYYPREYAEDRFGFDRFANDWRRYLQLES